MPAMECVLVDGEKWQLLHTLWLALPAHPALRRAVRDADETQRSEADPGLQRSVSAAPGAMIADQTRRVACGHRDTRLRQRLVHAGRGAAPARVDRICTNACSRGSNHLGYCRRTRHGSAGGLARRAATWSAGCSTGGCACKRRRSQFRSSGSMAPCCSGKDGHCPGSGTTCTRCGLPGSSIGARDVGWHPDRAARR